MFNIKKTNNIFDTQVECVQRSSYNRGFTLIESLVAIFIFSIALVALITITSRGITGTAQAKNQVIAQFLAQEGIELMRNYRDTGFMNGQTGELKDTLPQCKKTDSCTIINSNGSYTLEAGQGTYDIGILNSNDHQYSQFAGGTFERKIYFTPDPSLNPKDNVEVHSVVKWKNGSIQREIHLMTILTNWAQSSQ